MAEACALGVWFLLGVLGLQCRGPRLCVAKGPALQQGNRLDPVMVRSLEVCSKRLIG